MSTLAIVIDCWDPASPEFASLTPLGHQNYAQVIHHINHELAHSTDIVGTVFATYGVSALHPDLLWSHQPQYQKPVTVWHYPSMDIPLLLPILSVTGAHNILVMGCSWRACLFDRPVGLRRLFQSIGSQYNCQVIPQCCQNGNEDPSVVLTELTYGVEQNHWYIPYHYPNRYTLNHPDPTSNPPTKQIIRNSSSTWLNFFALKKQGR